MPTTLEQEQEAGRAALHYPRQHVGFQDPPEHDPDYHGSTEFERWVVHELRLIRGEVRQAHGEYLAKLQHMEHNMTVNTRALIAAVKDADTKMEGYVTIIAANTQAVLDARNALLALKDEPTSADIQSVIDDLTSHVGVVGDAVAHLAAAPIPPAPSAIEPQPVPQMPSATINQP